MTTTAELLKTFEDLAISQRKLAADIESIAKSQGMPLGDLVVPVNSLLKQAAMCDEAAEALRNGDAVSIDELNL